MSSLESNQRQIHRNTFDRRMPSVAAMGRDDDGDFSFELLFGVWNRWWKWLIPVTLTLIIVAAGVVMLAFKPKFRASSRIEISEQAPWVIADDSGQKAHRYVATQIEMLRSRRVLSAVLEDPTLAGMHEFKRRRDPVKWLSEKGLKIEPVGQSTLVEIRFDGVNPDAAANLVNSVVDSYFDTQSAQKTLRVQKILAVLRNNKTTQADTVSKLQTLVKTLSKDLDVLPNLSGTVMMQAVSPAQDIMNQIVKAEFELTDLQAAVTAIEDSLNQDTFTGSPALVKSEIDALPEVKSLRMEIQTRESLLGQIEATAAEGRSSSSYINAESEIRSLKSALDLLRVESEAKVMAQVREMGRLEVEAKLKDRKMDLAHQSNLIKKLEERYRRERAKVNAEGNKRLEYEFASQELQRSLALFAKISERESQLTAELGAPGRPEVYRRAVPNYKPIEKYPLIPLAATALASLLLPFGCILLWEHSVRRINSVEQLEAKANTEVIGEVSRLPTRSSRNAQAMGHELGLFEESIDSLRTGLLLTHEDNDIQVIAVCSAVSGEGKTSVSSQLAVSIARATGQPVLLIDGDMRAPDIHQIFEIPMSPGLADILGDSASLEESINRSWSEHVHILPAGELKKSPHKLLGTNAFASLLEEARVWYRYIVIDTPPVLAASESLVIAKKADGTIVCAMRDFSRESHVRLAHDRLRSTGAETIGTVLNGVPVRSYASRYGTYGRYAYTNLG